MERKIMSARISNAILVSVLMLISSTLALADESVGTVKLSKGEVNIFRNSASIPASINMKLMAADKITTGPNSSVGITLQDGTLLSFGAKSVSQLNEFRYDPVSRDGNILISVLKGSMRFVTGLLGKYNHSAVSIHTPTATIGIRGTDFIVAVEGGE
jgi:hypothetical protein